MIRRKGRSSSAIRARIIWSRERVLTLIHPHKQGEDVVRSDLPLLETTVESRMVVSRCC